MAEELLRSVIELEKSIQRQLEEEQRRASVWLKQEQQRHQQRLETERQRLAAAEEGHCRAAWQRLLTRLQRHEAQERERLEQFRRLAEARLPEVMAELLTEILPRDWHDHQDGEG